MKVLFDPQVFSFQEFGGISRYYCELLKQFGSLEGVEASLIIKYSNNRYLPDLGSIRTRPFFPSYRFKGRNEIIKTLNKWYVWRNFPSENTPDLVHPTYYSPYFLKVIGSIPFVLTIYDMSHELYPELFSTVDYTSSNKAIVASKAARIITISEHTKKDITAILKIPASSIDVIPLATTLSIKSVQVAIRAPDNFVLYVGKRNTYKNFPFLLDAFKACPVTQDGYALVCAGGGPWTTEETAKIDALGLSRRVIQMDVNDALLVFLYLKAGAFIFPSLYEGFGIPVLEAFACGCPALLSNRSSLPEVGGNAALYFEPDHVESLVAVLADVLRKKDLAEDLRARGFARALEFSWAHTALKTLETYNTILNNR